MDCKTENPYSTSVYSTTSHMIRQPFFKNLSNEDTNTHLASLTELEVLGDVNSHYTMKT